MYPSDTVRTQTWLRDTKLLTSPVGVFYSRVELFRLGKVSFLFLLTLLLSLEETLEGP